VVQTPEKDRYLTMSFLRRFSSSSNKKHDDILIREYPHDIRASGYCLLCRERYTDVPVIDGIAVCPNCYKIE